MKRTTVSYIYLRVHTCSFICTRARSWPDFRASSHSGRMVREAHELLDGSRPIPIDKITYELSQNIILAFDNNENVSKREGVEMEIEARVGLVVDKRKNRLKLPINTDAIIESNYSDFQSGVDRDSFEFLLGYLHGLTQKRKINRCNGAIRGECGLRGDGSANEKCNPVIGNAQESRKTHNNTQCNKEAQSRTDEENSIYEFVPLRTKKSVDKYYLLKDSNTRIRITTDFSEEEKESSESMVHSLYKENINTWNVHLGNNNEFFEDDEDDDDEEDGGGCSGAGAGAGGGIGSKSSGGKNDSVDYRISINLEHTKPISKLFLSKISPVHVRFKERTSFINKYLGIQLDLTKIKTKDNNELYEIEIEIPPKSVFKAMSNLRKKNDSNYLHFICSNLINNIRGICSHLTYFRKSNNLSKQPNDDNSNGLLNTEIKYFLPLKEKKKFKKYIHSVLPLVGDYMYRVVAKNEKSLQKMLNDKSISNSEKVRIFKDLIEIRKHNKRCLKTVSETHAENRWKIVKMPGSQNEIVLVSEDSDESNESDRSERDWREGGAEMQKDKEEEEEEEEEEAHFNRSNNADAKGDLNDLVQGGDMGDAYFNYDDNVVMNEGNLGDFDDKGEERSYGEDGSAARDASKYEDFYNDT
ncbi:RNA triphosphatase, putative [Plasmodium ovale wallikeri]|uniref:mRNA 5'-phosphatase n=1 Tax=Plasmodium ovale wallikeri TaxID=864142 RepID=A0A1A8YRJ3_PLAOA|nr:RNA triphosphatase, putative [Plasmodium ovale wallikeri]